MTDARNTDFLRQHGRLERRVSNLETGVHPTVSDIEYEKVGTGVETPTVDLTGYIHYGTNPGAYTPGASNVTISTGGSGASFTSSGATTLNTDAKAGGIALNAQAISGGDAIWAYSTNGTAIHTSVDTGTALDVGCGEDATAAIFRVGSDPMLTIGAGGVHLTSLPARAEAGLVVDGTLSVSGNLVVTGTVEITGSLFINGVAVIP